MTKQEIKDSLKTLEVEIKALKKIAKTHTNHIGYGGPQSTAQMKLHVNKLQVRGLLIAYAYLNGKPFSAPEKNPYNVNDSNQYSAMVNAKAALSMTQSKVIGSRTFHTPHSDESFDSWLMNTSSSVI